VCLLRRPLEPVKSRAARIAAIIPVLDEEGAIGPVLAAMPRDWVDQVIVVDGGSRDGTIAEARAGGATALVERVLSGPPRQPPRSRRRPPLRIGPTSDRGSCVEAVAMGFNSAQGFLFMCVSTVK